MRDVDVPRASILHVRLSASPQASHPVWFPDSLRAHPHAQDRCAASDAATAAEHAGDADFDDCTRAETAYFDQVQEEFEA